MIKREMINGLAHKLSNEVVTIAERNYIFTDLMQVLETDISHIVRNFVTDKNITSFNINMDDYISNLSYEGITNALMGYDQNKGDFIARLKVVGKNWMSNQFRKDFSQRSMAFSTKAASLDEMIDIDGFDVQDETNEYTFGIVDPTERLITDFIKSDKDGQVIVILALYSAIAKCNKTQ